MLNSSGIPDFTKPINLKIINPKEDIIDDDFSPSGTNVKTRIIYITDFSGLTDKDGSALRGRGSELGGSYTFVTDIGQNLITIS
jgi:hypothetical protein